MAMSNESFARFAEELLQKIDHQQQGVPTFADHVWLALISHVVHGGQFGPIEADAVARLQRLIERQTQGRFVDYSTRSRAADGQHGASDIEYYDMMSSQGAGECLRWRGMPLFKTVYDFSLYPMLLWALKPRTIIELGSGAGASALWLADLTETFGGTPSVFSVDLHPPAIQDARVAFVEGDCEAIERVFVKGELVGAAHPWLVIEDAHANVFGVLDFFHGYMQPGDYAVIEDSDAKRDEIGRFVARHPAGYKVDTYYTDFFGRNATSAQDSFLVRTAD